VQDFFYHLCRNAHVPNLAHAGPDETNWSEFDMYLIWKFDLYLVCISIGIRVKLRSKTSIFPDQIFFPTYQTLIKFLFFWYFSLFWYENSNFFKVTLIWNFEVTLIWNFEVNLIWNFEVNLIWNYEVNLISVSPIKNKFLSFLWKVEVGAATYTEFRY
jgi:hypothetical protein